MRRKGMQIAYQSWWAYLLGDNGLVGSWLYTPMTNTAVSAANVMWRFTSQLAVPQW